ncbi:tetratricopeptide repeat protein [Geomonas sp. Red875]|uniref:Tetratricopeptide repeat protein n=2 Tax=Geomesophilobacter sediminis TaxID=2798584 RepID=A0A8J7LZ71_9BACT|nr:tetratricopeptide repeat protein [Geomesophilobacter sediminis]
MESGDADAAELSFRKAIAINPGLAAAHTNLGLLLEQKGNLAEAEKEYRLSLSLNPEGGRTWLNLGVLLLGQKRLAEAEEAYRKSIALLPDFPPAWTNLGTLLASLRRDDEAEVCLRQAIELDPQYRSGYFNLSYLLLRQGRFEEGWECFEKRDWYRHFEARIPCPRWRGESVAGKALLLVFDAGNGDMIQFCRYASVLKERGAKLVTVIGHPPLKRLFRTMDGVDFAYGFDEEILHVEADYWTPPLSIPYYCRTRLDSIPARIPYLHADPELVKKWAKRLSDLSAPGDLRVGLVWQGSRNFENDADRSLPGLSTLEPLGGVGGVRFLSLQKGAGEDDAALPPAGLPVVNLASEIEDFADSAAIVSNLDLVISVDTAMAHLTGALGKPCWLLLPDYKTDWRWLDGRSDSPWYPGVMRLFRQHRMGEWVKVVEEVREVLETLVVSSPGRGNSPL